jgi:diadenosine tetraphosphatase ApaH/serine/threonine PP2A family protein phosphatase
MRALILSDIHANLDALEAVLAAAPDHEVVWNLGDIVGYGGNPNEVIERVRDLGTIFVRGNHDRVCSGLTTPGEFNAVAARAARWTQAVLTPEHTQWLQRLVQGPVRPNGPMVSCMHGSLLDEDEYMFSMRDAWQPLRDAVTHYNFFGHTHMQGGFAASGEALFKVQPVYTSRDGAEEFEVHLSESARYMLNPGSVGQPRDYDWRAAFAIYDDVRQTVGFFRVPYDVSAAQMSILRAGLPDRLAMRLREGR